MGFGLSEAPESGGWRYVGASVIGTSHVTMGLPCQDACLVRSISADSLLLVACDGAGSAKYSQEGSRIACDTVLQEAVTFLRKGGSPDGLNQDILDSWVEAVVSQLHRHASAKDTSVRDLACTLVMALVGNHSSTYLQIGDGAIVTFQEGSYSPVTWPEGGEYANTTFFVTDDRALDHIQLQLAQPPVDEIAVFSDGLQRLALQFDTRTAHGPFFEPMFARLRKEPPGESPVISELLIEYLGSSLINERTDDDKSLLLASRRREGGHSASRVFRSTASQARTTRATQELATSGVNDIPDTHTVRSEPEEANEGSQ
jgi:hypothetical protein